MPYITFSKNFRNQRELQGVLKRSKLAKNSAIELRGNKTVKKLVSLASAHGFKSIFVINKTKKKGEFAAIEIKIKEQGWKYGKERKMVIR